MKNSLNIFVGIIAAATAGVVIGMLIAPEKGEDLRKNIKDSAGDWTKKLSNLMADGKEQYNSLKTSFEDTVSELKHDGKSTKA